MMITLKKAKVNFALLFGIMSPYPTVAALEKDQ